MLEARRMASGAVLGGGYDGPDRRIRLTQQFDQLEAVAAWHVKVSQDEIGLEPGRQGETIQPIVRLPHDLNAQERLQDVAQEGHAYVAVVHNHDANLACRGGCRVIWCEIVAHDTGTIGYTCVSRYQVNPVFSASALPETWPECFSQKRLCPVPEGHVRLAQRFNAGRACVGT